MRKDRVVSWFLVLTASLMGCGSGSKPADITDTEYVRRVVESVLAQEGCECQNIQVASPMLAQMTSDSKGRLTRVLTVQGTYDALFKYRRKGSQDAWTELVMHFIVTYADGKWSYQVVPGK